MTRTPGKPVRILFQQVTPAFIRKAMASSADATSGGGARDLRLRPDDKFRPFMERLLPQSRSQVRRGRNGAEDENLIIHFGTVTWGDGTEEREIEYWPPTNARVGEGRIARISSLPPLQVPPIMIEGAVVLFVEDVNGVIWVRYASAEGLRQSLREISDLIRLCLESAEGTRLATGYIDYSVGEIDTWCNADVDEGEE